MSKQVQFGEPQTKTKKEKSGWLKEAIAKFSRGVMLPIAMLPIAGLALGVGTTIVSQSHNEIVQTIGNIIMMAGNIVFAVLPLLFAIAIAITFTNDSGTAGLSAFLGWLIFSVVQAALIISPHGTDTDYHFLWYTFTPEKFTAIFTTVLGINTLSTSLFGGIVTGIIVAYLYNRFKLIRLPKLIGFFSGVRFIPIITFVTMIVVSLFFAMVWPMIGLGLFYFGMGLSYGGQYGGVTQLAYGIFNRMLVPFGLHHVMNTLLWFSNIGGTINTSQHFFVNGQDTGYTWAALAGETAFRNVDGDINIQIFMTKIIGNNHVYGHQITIQMLIDSYKANPANSGGNLMPGQYTNFAYVFCMFGLPGAAVGMVFAAPKGENRNIAASIVIPGALVSSLTGASEAIEFTFLFLAPWLFFGFHAVMFGIAGMICTLLGYYAPSVAPHVTFSFSQGIIDFVIYGVVPDIRGGGTHCWMLLLLSLAYFPIYWAVFQWAIKKWNFPTPGRGGQNKLFTKADWVKKQNEEKSKGKNVLNDKAFEIIQAYGGANNIVNVDACITKLRIQVKDKKPVDSKKLMELGALGVTHPSPKSVYSVFGTDADLFKNIIKDIIKNNQYQDWMEKHKNG